MERKQQIKTSVRHFVEAFSCEHGFKLYQKTFALRIKNDLLQIVCFDFPPSGMQCHVAIQPLYIPEDNINFTFGNLLNRFMINKPGLWGIDITKIEDDIREISKLLETYIIPWFDKVSSARSLIEYVNSRNINDIRCPPYFTNTILGFSYLYINDFRNAKYVLNKRLELSSNLILHSEREKLIQLMLSLIDLGEYEKIKELLNDFTELTKKNCKLDQIN